MTGPPDDGYVIIALVVLAAGLCVARMRFTASKGLRISAGLAVLLNGLLGAYNALLNLSSLGLSIGIVVFGLSSFTLIASACLILINVRGRAR